MTASARESTVTARAGDWLLRSAPSHPQAMTEWEESGAAWLLPGVVQKALLPVPAPDVTSPIESGGPWWVSPLNGPALLCPPARVVAFAALGRDALAHVKGHPGA